ncbi:MAG: BACON domain-containing protein [Myxococcaceae bacterium]|nr:BACON domain-containing protein [Myxococcaceae bacterium]
MARRQMRWGLRLALASLWLSACGSGAGDMHLSVDSTSIVFQDVSGKAPEAQLLSARIRPLTQSVFVGIAFTQSGLESVAYDLSGNPFPILVTPKDPEALGSGTQTDQVIIAACVDEECTQHIAGSPVIVDVTYTVRSYLTAEPAELSFAHALGSNAPPGSLPLSVQSPFATHWSASASSSWIHLSGDTQGAAPGGPRVEVDPSGLPLGTHRGSVTLTAMETGETVDVPVTLRVKPAAFVPTPPTLSFGGQDGLELSAKTLALGLDTGSNAYDWTAVVDTGAGPQWLKLSSTSGEVSASATPITVSVDPTALKDGVHTASLRFTSSVAGQTITQDVPVSLLLAPHKLWVPDNGVGLVSMPSVSRLTHTVKVKDNWGLSTTPWTASSDQPWLSVTPSGTGGGSLTLTANPASLAADQIHYATVTLGYDDGLVQGSETVRVGLWVGSQPPSSQGLNAGLFPVFVTDPIRPYVYLRGSLDSSISVYNLYTAGLVAQVTGLDGHPGRMAISSDGSTLYVLITSNNRIVPVDLSTFTGGASSGVRTGNSYGITYARPNGHGLVLINGGDIYDPAAGAVLTGVTGSLADIFIGSASLDGSLVCGSVLNFSTSLNCYGLRYSEINGGLVTLTVRGAGPFGIASIDLAINQDGSRVYAFLGTPGAIAVYDGQTTGALAPLATGASCDSFEVGPDDRIYAASEFARYDPKELWVFDSAGTLLDSYRVTSEGDFIQGGQLKVSGDGRRLVVLTGDGVLKFVTMP